MAFDAFLKLDGIPGESQDAKHKDEIEIHSYSWGVSNTGIFDGGGGTGAGKASFRDFAFTADTVKAMPLLFEACASGKHIKEGLLTLRGSGERGLEYLKFRLQDIIVTGLNEAGSTEGDRPVDEVSLLYREIEVTYTPQNPDGSAGTPIVKRWNVVENRA